MRFGGHHESAIFLEGFWCCGSGYMDGGFGRRGGLRAGGASASGSGASGGTPPWRRLRVDRRVSPVVAVWVFLGAGPLGASVSSGCGSGGLAAELRCLPRVCFWLWLLAVSMFSEAR